MSFLELENKTLLVSGVANKKSVAYFCAQSLLEQKAQVIFTAQSEVQKKQIEKLFPGPSCLICDVEKKDDILNLGQALAKKNIKLDGFIHSLAFANFSQGPKPFHETSREDFLQAAQISCFSLVEMSQVIKPFLNQNASVVTISISNTKATSYGYLGPIKAMLESCVNYLAKSFSFDSQIRFNAVGAGPLKTSASAGIPNYIENYFFAEALSLRKKSLETQEVANTVLFLLSPKSSGINSSTVIVDAGMSSNYFDQDVVNKFGRIE